MPLSYASHFNSSISTSFKVIFVYCGLKWWYLSCLGGVFVLYVCWDDNSRDSYLDRWFLVIFIFLISCRVYSTWRIVFCTKVSGWFNVWPWSFRIAIHFFNESSITSRIHILNLLVLLWFVFECAEVRSDFMKLIPAYLAGTMILW